MFGSYPIGTAVIGGTAGGAIIKGFNFDMIVVDQKLQQTAFDMIVVATIVKQTAFDLIVAASNQKLFAFDMIVYEPIKDNLPMYQNVGNNLAMPIDKPRTPKWSTNNRPNPPVPWQYGTNTTNGKIEYYNPYTASWKNADGTAV